MLECKDCVLYNTDACRYGRYALEHDMSIQCDDFIVEHNKAYQQGRADELDKIYKMMLLGCDELKCEECVYEQHSQDVCQQAFTFGMIEEYIEEQLKEQK